jgi:hypothetical protein
MWFQLMLTLLQFSNLESFAEKHGNILDEAAHHLLLRSNLFQSDQSPQDDLLGWS